jgi:hypothetical protein
MPRSAYAHSFARTAGRLVVMIAVLSMPPAVLITTVVTFLPGPPSPCVSAARPGEGLATCAPGVQWLGFSDALNKTSFGGFTVADLSGLTYDPQRRVYYSIADRAGSADTHVFTLDLPVGSESFGTPTILDVTRLRDAAGNAFTGATFDGGAGLTGSPRSRAQRPTRRPGQHLPVGPQWAHGRGPTSIMDLQLISWELLDAQQAKSHGVF